MATERSSITSEQGFSDRGGGNILGDSLCYTLEVLPALLMPYFEDNLDDVRESDLRVGWKLFALFQGMGLSLLVVLFQ